jgi:serine/threonine protein kinase
MYLVMKRFVGHVSTTHPFKTFSAKVAHALNVLTFGSYSLEYCHRLLIAHNDVRPENFLFSDSGNIVLADFGQSTRVSILLSDGGYSDVTPLGEGW